MVRSKLVGGATVLAALTVGVASGSANPPVDVPARLSDPLLGSWDTGRIAMQRVRDSMASHGYTKAEIEVFWRRFGLGRAEMWRFNLRFYRRRGTPRLTKTGWDPSKTVQPVDGDEGRYSLLPHGRISIIDSAPTLHRYREVFAYRIVGRKLTLRAISETDPTLTKKQLRLDMLFMYTMAAAPLKKG